MRLEAYYSKKLLELGKYAYKHQEFELALQHYNAVLDINPSNKDAQHYRKLLSDVLAKKALPPASKSTVTPKLSSRLSPEPREGKKIADEEESGWVE